MSRSGRLASWVAGVAVVGVALLLLWPARVEQGSDSKTSAADVGESRVLKGPPGVVDLPPPATPTSRPADVHGAKRTTLTVRVTSGDVPVTNAVVAVDGAIRVRATDVVGRATFAIECSFIDSIVVTAEGFETGAVHDVPCRVGADNEVVVDLARAGRVEVEVVTRQDAPILGLRLGLADWPRDLATDLGLKTRSITTTTSNDDGVAIFENVSPGRYWLLADGYVAERRSGVLDVSDAIHRHRLVLTAREPVLVRLVDELSHEPVGDGVVVVAWAKRDGPDRYSGTVTTDPAGTAIIYREAAIPLELNIRGNEAYEDRTFVVDSSVSEVVVPLRAARRSYFMVLSSKGEYLNESVIRLRDHHSIRSDYAVANNLVFTVPVHEARTALQVRSAAGESSRWFGSLGLNGTADRPQTITLAAPGVIAVQLVNEDGDVVSGVRIDAVLVLYNGPEHWTRTRRNVEATAVSDDQGRVTVPLPAGELFVLLLRGEYGANLPMVACGRPGILDVGGPFPGTSLGPDAPLVRIQPGEARDLGVVTLSAAGVVEVTAEDGRGSVGSAQVWLMPDRRNRAPSAPLVARASTKGVAVFRGVAAGRYWVHALRPTTNEQPPMFAALGHPSAFTVEAGGYVRVPVQVR